MDDLNSYPNIGPNLDHWKLFVNLSRVGIRELIVNSFYLVAIGRHEIAIDAHSSCTGRGQHCHYVADSLAAT